MILFTVVRSPRFESMGTTCHGLHRHRANAQGLMEDMAREALEEDREYSEEEIDEVMNLDNIDLASCCFHVAPIYLTDESLQPGQIL